MSSADFRHIAVRGKVHKAERLFRAAVSAFCALTRPNRREIAQFEDLTLELFDAQSRETKRFAAAALSDAAETPNALIRRLCEESVDIAAPLLIRSNTLSDIDLIALIGRHGIAHARAIARRGKLHPAIAALIRALEAQQPRLQLQAEQTIMPEDAELKGIGTEQNAVYRPAASISKRSPMPQDAHSLPAAVPVFAPTAPAKSGAAAERMRDRLRGFMAPADLIDEAPKISKKPKQFQRLKMTALTGNPVFFQTALADALDIEFSVAHAITTSGGYTSLLAALKALDLNETQAFLLAAAVFPTFFSHAEAIRLFVERYHLMHHDAALEMVRGWRAESVARSFLRTQPPAPGNSDANVVKLGRLRAS